MTFSYENYHRENNIMMINYAERCACRLPSLAKRCTRLDKAIEELRHIALDEPLVCDRDYYHTYDNLISIKKYALLEWEKTVAMSVQTIKKWGSDSDKAILKENMYWIRGVRSVDELFNKRRKDLDKPHWKNWGRIYD